MTGSSTIAIVFLVVVIAVLALKIAPFWRQKRKEHEERTRQLQIVAGQRAWTFVSAATLDAIPGCESFGLFSKGHSKTIENMMAGETDGIRMAVFDYLYVGDHGEQGDYQGYSQTVIQLRASNLRVPYFSLQPENILHKLFPNFGFQDIDFEQRPVFSNQYLLSGDDETAIRNTFTDRLLAFYEMNPGISTEGREDQLFMYRDNQVLEPAEILSLIDPGLDIFKLIQQRETHHDLAN